MEPTIIQQYILDCYHTITTQYIIYAKLLAGRLISRTVSIMHLSYRGQ